MRLLLLRQSRQHKFGQKQNQERKGHYQPGIKRQLDHDRERIGHAKICKTRPVRINRQQRPLDDFHDGLLKRKGRTHHQGQAQRAS